MKLRHRSVFILFVLLVFLAGCGEKNPTDIPPTAAAQNPAATLASVPLTEEGLDEAEKNYVEPIPDPVTVAVELDTVDSVQAYVPEQGGQITLKLTNGTIYDLEIPAGALNGGQVITMTPIRKMTNPLSGSLLAGVQLEPDGLYLYEPAVLTVTLPQEYSLAGDQQVAGFGYHGGGERFHLTPSEAEGKTIRLELSTFSGHGVGIASDTDVQDLSGRSTGNAVDDMEAARANNEASSDGDVEALRDRMRPILLEQYLRIRIQLKAAATDDRMCDPAIQAFFNWMRQVDLLSLEAESPFDRLREEGMGRALRALENAFDKAAERCISDKNLDEIGRMYQRLKEIALLGDDNGEYSVENKFREIVKCVKFDAAFTSKMTYEEEKFKIEIIVEGTGTLAPVELEGSPLSPGYPIPLKGTGELKTISYTVDFGDGTCTAKLDSPTGKAFWAGIFDARTGYLPPARVIPIAGFTWTGMQQRVTSINCGGEDGSTFPNVMTTPIWAAGFSTIHKWTVGEYGPILSLVTPGKYIEYFTPILEANSLAVTVHANRNYSHRFAEGYKEHLDFYIIHNP